ncbi:MAG TPA: hypothetical protein VMB53_06270, partial [Gaiellaceae bacterium]|nr:hypothetical protein [Gaiellaceae bacterium]
MFAALAALLGAGALLLALHHGGRVDRTAVPSFVQRALGPRTPGARLKTNVAPGTTARILPSGFEVSSAAGRVRLTQTQRGAKGWRRFENGTSRARPFGHEAIVLGGAVDGGEQYLVVDRHLGTRTWRWRLDTGKLTPTLRPDGSVLVSPPHVVAGFRIAPLAIYDAHGRNVTPAGLGWGLERRRGSWWLTLGVDDATLPLPYVVDPSTASFRSAQSANSGGGATTITITKPAGLALNDLMIATIAVRGGTNVAICPPTVTGTWTSFISNNSTTVLHQETFWKVATASDVSATNYVFTFGTTAGCATTSSQKAAGGIAAFFGVNDASPIDASNGQNNASSTTVTAPSITNGTIGNLLVGSFGSANGAANFWTPPGGTPTFTERWDNAATGGAANTRATSELATATTTATGATGTKAATGTAAAVNIGQLMTLALDTVNPTNTITIASVGAGNAFLSGTNLYYRGVAAGNFQLQDAVSDSGSGPASAQFPALGGTTTGWTHTTQTVTTPAGGPYVTTNNFSWTAGTTSGPTEGVVGSDNATNSATTTLTFVNDSTAPTAAVTFPSAAAYNAAGWTGSLTGTASDGGSGVNAVKVSIQDTTVGGSSCWNGSSFTAACPNYVTATGTTSWSYSLAGSNLTDGHSYTATVQTIDNLTNTDNAATTATWKYDTTNPTNALTIASVGAGNAFLSGTNLYYRGIAAGNFQLQDAVSDSFSGAAQASFPALGGTTTGWTHTAQTVTTPAGGPYVTTNNFSWTAGTTSGPTEGVVGSDAAGNTATTTLTFVNDNTAPTAAVTFPSAAYYNSSGWTGSLTGTSSDSDSGVNAVKLSIQDTTVGGSSCWNGSSFTAACPNYVTATGTTSWSYSLAGSNLTDGHNYTATVETIDNLTNTATSAATASWMYDTTNP